VWRCSISTIFPYTTLFRSATINHLLIALFYTGSLIFSFDHMISRDKVPVDYQYFSLQNHLLYVESNLVLLTLQQDKLSPLTTIDKQSYAKLFHIIAHLHPTLE